MGYPVVHFDIGCRDAGETVDFYTRLFGWESESYGPSSARLDTRSDRGISGFITALGHEPHSYVMIYVEVDDLEACLQEAESLGGKTTIPPTEVPGQGRFAWLADPAGNTIGLWTTIE